MEMVKNKGEKLLYVLDTNVLVSDPHALYAFDEHDVCIIDITLEELDNLKSKPDEVGAAARAVVRELNKLREQGNIKAGVEMNSQSGKFFVELNHTQEELPEGWSEDKADHRILRACKALKRTGRNVVLVSNDNIIKLKADIMGVPAEEYRTLKGKDPSEQYKGRREVCLEPGAIGEFFTKKQMDTIPIAGYSDMIPLVTNEFLIMRDITDPKKSALGRYDGEKIVPLMYSDSKPFGMRPRNVGQKFAVEALMTPAKDAPLVIIKGGAGTAKTFCALAAGLEQVVERPEQSTYRKILVARPNVKFDEDIGYLKGSEEDKIEPLLRPVMDNLECLMALNPKNREDSKTLQSAIRLLFDYGHITAEALAYFRGRSINFCYTIIDECQNVSPIQAFGIITRAGVDSKIVLLGDPKQIDNTYLDSKTNGLTYASETMKGNPLCWQVTFNDDECVRSDLAIAAIESMTPKGFKSFRRR